MSPRAKRHVLHDVAPGRAEIIRILELLRVVIAGREHHQYAAAGRDRDAIEDDLLFGKPAPALHRRVDAKRLLGFVPDSAAVYESLTGLEFLLMIASLYGVGEDKAVPRIWQFLNLFDLDEVPDRQISAHLIVAEC